MAKIDGETILVIGRILTLSENDRAVTRRGGSELGVDSRKVTVGENVAIPTLEANFKKTLSWLRDRFASATTPLGAPSLDSL